MTQFSASKECSHLIYRLDPPHPDCLKDWTIFCGEQCREQEDLSSDGKTFRALFNRKIDPGHLVIAYEASVPAGAEPGSFSDLSCHIGPVRFQFGSRGNTVTGIAGPGKRVAAVATAPCITPGRSHQVRVEVNGLRCLMQVDGQPAGELRLDGPLDDAAWEFYSWAGKTRFGRIRLYGETAQNPRLLTDAPWIRERNRLRDMRQSIVWIEHKGKFLHECSLEGEERRKGIYPAHPNGIRLSEDRFLVLYTTRAYRGDDDEKSGIYQLRRGGFDGPLLKEGWICRTSDQWHALGDEVPYVRQYGHPVAFGVPKGALHQGKRRLHENVFVVLWRKEARWVDPATGFMAYVHENPALRLKTATTEWMQFRLNDREDDIEILRPVLSLRQFGYEDGDLICQHETVSRMTCNFVQPVPYNADASEWVHADTLYTGEGAIAGGGAGVGIHQQGAVGILRFRFDSKAGCYRWVETSPLFGPKSGLFEGSLLSYRGSWIVMARRIAGDGVAYGRTNDLFGSPPPVIVAKDQPNRAPTCAYLCPDGVMRRTGGLPNLSPYGMGRDPLYLMDIDPDHGFIASNPRVVFDARRAGIPIPSSPIVDFGKLLPHTGGASQLILHRVRSPMLNDPKRPGRGLTPEEIEASGIYWARIHYREEWPGTWDFGCP